MNEKEVLWIVREFNDSDPSDIRHEGLVVLETTNRQRVNIFVRAALESEPFRRLEIDRRPLIN